MIIREILINLKRWGGTFVYYSVIYYLPQNYSPLIGKYSKKFKGFFLHLINKEIERNTDIGRKVYLGNIQDLSIEKNSGLGNRFKMQNVRLRIGEDVMCAEDVLIIGGGHKYSSKDIPMIKQGDLYKTTLTVEDDVWIGALKLSFLLKILLLEKGQLLELGQL